MKISLEPGAIMPRRAHNEDAGLDLCVPYKEGGESAMMVIIKPHTRFKIDTGVHVQIPKDCVGFLKSKSGLMAKKGVTTDGTIDEGYTGTIQVVVFNHSDEDVVFSSGDKITQLVIQKIEKPDLELVDKLDEAPRGDAGFGSTGTSIN